MLRKSFRWPTTRAAALCALWLVSDAQAGKGQKPKRRKSLATFGADYAKAPSHQYGRLDAPSCLAELDRRYRARGLSILGLAFELTGDLERDTRQVQRFRERYQIEYPILVAGIADKQDASRRFPLLDRVRAYPTTIFLDAAGNVRAVHTGFAGPATGPEHQHLRAEFERLIEDLLEEPATHD